MGNQTKTPHVLVVGESWIKHTVHLKGFDEFHSTEYEEGGSSFIEALRAGGCTITYVRAHEVSNRFPTTMDELADFDVVVLSDIGANSFLLTDNVFLRSEPGVNRLGLVREFVRQGGGLVMIGGYMSFSGIDGRARFGMSPLAEVLPVTMLNHDDRVEVPEGFKTAVVCPGHPVLQGVSPDWPLLLGYNRTIANAHSTVVACRGDDPVLVVGEVGRGRAVAFTPDCAPHWAPPEFVAWEHYGQLWTSIVRWAGGRGEV